MKNQCSLIIIVLSTFFLHSRFLQSKLQKLMKGLSGSLKLASIEFDHSPCINFHLKNFPCKIFVKQFPFHGSKWRVPTKLLQKWEEGSTRSGNQVSVHSDQIIRLNFISIEEHRAFLLDYFEVNFELCIILKGVVNYPIVDQVVVLEEESTIQLSNSFIRTSDSAFSVQFVKLLIFKHTKSTMSGRSKQQSFEYELYMETYF